jgi:hypothetical protein
MTVITVSRQCQAQMHLHCTDENCGCPYCHKQCEVCGQKCRAIYQTPDTAVLADDIRDKPACMACYLAASSLVPQPRCEVCAGSRGYRDPGDGDGLYLCISCRAAFGLAYQNRGL